MPKLLFPALRSGPTAVSGASRQKQIPSSRSISCRGCWEVLRSGAKGRGTARQATPTKGLKLGRPASETGPNFNAHLTMGPSTVRIHARRPRSQRRTESHEHESKRTIEPKRKMADREGLWLPPPSGVRCAEGIICRYERHPRSNPECCTGALIPPFVTRFLGIYDPRSSILDPRSKVAEREGFEPSVELPLRSLSKGVLSTTQPPFLEAGRGF